MGQKPGWLGFAGILDSACDDVDRNRSGCGCTAKRAERAAPRLPRCQARRKLDVIDTASGSVRRAGLTPELGRWRKTLMRRYWMSSGSAATREASPRYARIHLVGRRPIEAI